MLIESVLVTPGILPPTINTTPNSPMVCANVRAVAVMSPGIDKGTTTCQNVRNFETPNTADAAKRRESTAVKEAASGWTVKGRLYKTDPITSPLNVKASGWPVMDCHHLPKGLRCPRASKT